MPNSLSNFVQCYNSNLHLPFKLGYLQVDWGGGTFGGDCCLPWPNKGARKHSVCSRTITNQPNWASETGDVFILPYWEFLVRISEKERANGESNWYVLSICIDIIMPRLHGLRHPPHTPTCTQPPNIKATPSLGLCLWARSKTAGYGSNSLLETAFLDIHSSLYPIYPLFPHRNNEDALNDCPLSLNVKVVEIKPCIPHTEMIIIFGLIVHAFKLFPIL